jgi:hypothetical protein
VKFINKIKAIVEWFDGKKSYLTSVVIALVAVVDALGVIVPDWVYILLTAVLGVSIRSALPKK